jgi:Flp pilus assembly protein TadD
MDWLKTFWGWLSNSKNQRTLAFIGVGLAVIISAGWQAYIHWSKPESPNPTPPNITATHGGIAAGRDVLIQGDVTYQGISEERFQRLSEELGVTKAALSSFFKILKQKHIPPEDLDNKLGEIARNYKTLQEKLTRFSSDDPAVATLKRQAKESLEAGEFDRAEAQLNEASEKEVEAAIRMQEIAHRCFLCAAVSKAENGNLKYMQLEFAEAAEYFRQAAELVPAGEELALAVYLNQQGRMAIYAGDYTGAEPPIERALAIREKSLGPEHPDVAKSLNSLASIYDSQGKYAEAELLDKRALAIREKSLGPEHPDVAKSLNSLAIRYRVQGKYAEAEPLYKRSLAITEKARGPEHPDVAGILNNLAVLYYSQGKYAEAEPLHKRSLAITEKARGPEHPNISSSLENYANLLRKLNRNSEAAKMQARAKAIRGKHTRENPTK